MQNVTLLPWVLYVYGTAFLGERGRVFMVLMVRVLWAERMDLEKTMSDQGLCRNLPSGLLSLADTTLTHRKPSLSVT